MDKFDVMQSHRQVQVQVRVCRLAEAKFRGRWALRLMRLALVVFGGQPLIITTNLDQAVPQATAALDLAALVQVRAAYMAQITAGICPHCAAPFGHREQVGSCVVAQPCGHRLYQGRLPG